MSAAKVCNFRKIEIARSDLSVARGLNFAANSKIRARIADTSAARF